MHLFYWAETGGEFQKQHSKNEDIARVLNVSMRKIDRVKKRFVEDGYDIALNGGDIGVVYGSSLLSSANLR